MNCQSFQLSNIEKSSNLFECRKTGFTYYGERGEKCQEVSCEKSSIYTTIGYEDGQI